MLDYQQKESNDFNVKVSCTAFFTTIFPSSTIYLDDFFISLQDQSIDDFDVIVVNDGVGNFGTYIKKYNELNIIEVLSSQSPAKNREVGIKKIIELGYEYVVFGDSDDYFSSNRVATSLELLKKYDVVVNDLTLFNDDGIITKKYLSNRIKSNTKITKEFVIDKNIFGLSNTAVKVDKLQLIDLNIPESLVAVDWYLFSLLLLEGCRAVFSNAIETYYRQHSENTVGMGEFNLEKLKNNIRIKLLHYKALSNQYAGYSYKYKQVLDLNQAILNKEYINKILKRKLEMPFWWE